MKQILLMVLSFLILTACGERRKPDDEVKALQVPEEATDVNGFREEGEPEIGETVTTAEIDTAQPETETASEPQWGEVARFGPTTTVWIEKGALDDEQLIAEILAEIEGRYGRGMVWFFDDKQYTPRRAPMTDREMLHWVGSYDAFRSETFSRVVITDRTSRPPKYQLQNTDIKPKRGNDD